MPPTTRSQSRPSTPKRSAGNRIISVRTANTSPITRGEHSTPSPVKRKNSDEYINESFSNNFHSSDDLQPLIINSDNWSDTDGNYRSRGRSTASTPIRNASPNHKTYTQPNWEFESEAEPLNGRNTNEKRTHQVRTSDPNNLYPRSNSPRSIRSPKPLSPLAGIPTHIGGLATLEVEDITGKHDINDIDKEYFESPFLADPLDDDLELLPQVILREQGLLNRVAEKNRKSSVSQAVFNFTNSIIGAGIMGLPFAMYQAGIGAGIILLFFLTYVVDWSVILLVQNGKLSGTKTYQDMVLKALGKPGYVAISIFQFLMGFGGMAAYMVIVADTMPKVMKQFVGPDSFLSSRSFNLTFLTLTVMLPLSCYKNVTKLANTSFISLVAVMSLVFIVMIEAPLNAYEPSPGAYEFFHGGIFQAIGVISFAFVCHHNSFIIYGSLEKPTLNRFSTVAHWSTGFSLVASLCLAIPGYLSFTEKTQGNILNNFPEENTIINIGRFCFAFTMFLTFPMECFVAREVIEHYFYKDRPFSNFRHYVTTITLVSITYTIAMSTCDLGFLLQLTGGLSATALAFILPPACYITLSSGSYFSSKKWFCWFIIAFGILTLVLSTYFTILEAIESSGQPQKC